MQKMHTKIFKIYLSRSKTYKKASLIIIKKNNIKMTWTVLKEVIGQNSSRRQRFLNKINLETKFKTSTDNSQKL